MTIIARKACGVRQLVRIPDACTTG